MKKVFFSLCLGMSCILSAQDPTATQQIMQQQFQELIQLDAQIEGLIKQRLELQQQLIEHKERQETAIRPRVDLRQEDAISTIIQEIQACDQKIQMLQEQRTQVLINLQPSIPSP